MRREKGTSNDQGQVGRAYLSHGVKVVHANSIPPMNTRGMTLVAGTLGWTVTSRFTIVSSLIRCCHDEGVYPVWSYALIFYPCSYRSEYPSTGVDKLIPLTPDPVSGR